MMPRLSLIPALVPLLACGRAPALRPNVQSTCVPAPDNLEAGRPAPIPSPGQYELTMVAVTGSHAGKQATGYMTLRAAHPGDVSPKTGERALTDTADAPRYGWLTFDFAAVGAPVYLPDALAPPTSQDPVYPGVIVKATNPTQSNELPTLSLWIGTIDNRRDGKFGVDGGGIALNVLRVSGDTLQGTWDHVGILYDGSGYFCMRRMGS